LSIANQFLPILKPVLRTVIIGFTIGKKTRFDSGENRFWHRKKNGFDIGQKLVPGPGKNGLES